MSIKSVKPPHFELRFLLPQFWLVWLGVFFLYLITWLPYRIILLLGKGVGRLIKKLAPKRVAVAKQNLQLTFPEWSDDKINAVFEANVYRTGMALFETAMGWWWPSWRVKRHIEFEGIEHVEQILKSGKGVFGLAIHNVNLEFACRGIGFYHPSIAFYRKHNNPLIDYLQYHGRNRSNKYMIHKRNAKALIQALNDNELCLYLPDQDYGPAQSIFVPFGGVVQTATTTATLMFAERANCVPLLITPMYTKTGYKIKFCPAIEYLADNNKERALTKLNQDILELVEMQPESYLWMHKRFKTRPPEAPESLYEQFK
ncbi:LpxL/LpxP family Kdo(2)-lipid IV(A) lauroyl/palmitoleoyl acyltransferase [Glaciecola sp. 1036]|uniref:LpxL/LpxP family Kdo(2)-lipid IV(A) lauroyl/palmitoleoyl acyltransferase n=1 Tax=Alteromonadaceae TaxID=72275 RepID=UPI003D07C0E9